MLMDHTYTVCTPFKLIVMIVMIIFGQIFLLCLHSEYLTEKYI